MPAGKKRSARKITGKHMPRTPTKRKRAAEKRAARTERPEKLEVEAALEVLTKFFDGPDMEAYRGMRPKLIDLKVGLETVFRRQGL